LIFSLLATSSVKLNLNLNLNSRENYQLGRHENFTEDYLWAGKMPLTFGSHHQLDPDLMLMTHLPETRAGNSRE